MLNRNKERELAYVVLIDSLEPIEGRDFVECARVKGWSVMVRKGEFTAGAPAVYFEVDSRTPAKEPFMFLKSKGFKIKTQKYKNFYSQGLLMPASDFGWTVEGNKIIDSDGAAHCAEDESRFLTKQLGITYADAEDNKRKKNLNKYDLMLRRLGKKGSRWPIRWLAKSTLGKKILFAFYGKKEDKRGSWPSHICSKTDVERIENEPFWFENKEPLVASEKVDGSSCTFAAERGAFGRIKHYVCSRNVVFENPDQANYYADMIGKNIYYEAYVKYDIERIIDMILKDYMLDNVAIQCEIYGSGVQKRDYSLPDGERRIAVFHIVSNRNRFTMDQVVEICERYGLPHVDIIDDEFVMPDTVEELREYVYSAPSVIDGKMKEGIVFYRKDNGNSFIKCVSPKYLLKYH